MSNEKSVRYRSHLSLYNEDGSSGQPTSPKSIHLFPGRMLVDLSALTFTPTLATFRKPLRARSASHRSKMVSAWSQWDWDGWAPAMSCNCLRASLKEVVMSAARQSLGKPLINLLMVLGMTWWALNALGMRMLSGEISANAL